MDDRPSEISMMHPIDLPLDREYLVALVESNLAAIHAMREVEHESLEQRRWAAAMIQQRADFLDWLRRQPDEAILMSMYPADQVDELLAELPDFGDDDPFEQDLPPD